MSNFKGLIIASRVYRTLPSLMAMVVPAAFTNQFSSELFILGLSCILIYSAASLHNAIIDKDYPLPGYSYYVIFILMLSALALSLSNWVIFLASFSWILLGLAYNTVARRILFGDAIVLSVTHFGIPVFGSSLLLQIDITTSAFLAAFMIITLWPILNMKNLKDTEEDKKRKYTTLTTAYAKGEKATKILLYISFPLMSAAYFLFNLNITYMLFLAVILAIMLSIDKVEKHLAHNMVRLLILFFISGIVICKTTNWHLILVASIICLAYSLVALPIRLLGKSAEKGAEG